MWAVYHKEKDGIAWQSETKQFLIFSSKAAAWDCILNKMNAEIADDYDVIEITWSRK